MRTTIFSGFPGGARPRGALLLAAAVTIALPLAESTAEAQPLVYYGGGVISNVQIVQVAWTPEVSADRKDKLSDFYKTILGTTYLDWLQEYDTIGLLGVDGLPGSDQHIGRGAFVGAFVVTPSIQASSLEDADIQLVLAEQIGSGALPEPDLDDKGHVRSLYMIDFPPGYEITHGGMKSCVVFGAYHSTLLIDGLAVPYGVHPDCGGSFGSTTTVHTHELVEAITDPDTGLASGLARPMAWREADALYLEITDICEPTVGLVAGYKVAKHWSNYAGACVLQVPVCDGELAPPACRNCTAYDEGFSCGGQTPSCAMDGARKGQCVACAGSTPLCDTEANTCVGCLQATDCKDPQAFVCDAKTRSCRGCQSNDECQSGMCDTTTDSQAGQCVECLTDAECGAEEVCEAHACVDRPAPTTDTSGDADSDGGCAMGRGAGDSSGHGWMFWALGGLAAAWSRLRKRSAGRPLPPMATRRVSERRLE